MSRDPASEKQEAHQLIDRLDAGQLSAVVRLLQFMLLDPVTRALASAALDDEPETDREKEAVGEAREYFARGGKGIPHEEILREFGLR